MTRSSTTGAGMTEDADSCEVMRISCLRAPREKFEKKIKKVVDK